MADINDLFSTVDDVSDEQIPALTTTFARQRVIFHASDLTQAIVAKSPHGFKSSQFYEDVFLKNI